MKWFAWAMLVLFVGAAIAQSDSKQQKTKSKGTVIFIAPTPSRVDKDKADKDKAGTDKGKGHVDGNIAEWIRVGSLVNVVVEEPGTPTTRTVFEGRRVSALADEIRGEKDGLAVTVQLSSAQTKAFEILKESGKVKVERHRDTRDYRTDKDFKKDK
jgi:hypothetical protein